jgi:threonine aldolase
MSRIIDLRSDTVSKPGPEMRRVMAEAEVGDDVFSDDPSVNRLEAMAAERLGKEAAMYVPSGTMANLAAVLSHTSPGQEVVLGDRAHIFNMEAGGASRLGGVQMRVVRNLADGGLDPAEVAEVVRAETMHSPGTGLIALENTHNFKGGTAVPVETVDALAELAHSHGLPLHMDGARIFNAQAALGVPASRIARECDSVSFCLSKGLGCPVGSLLCGAGEFIESARRFRKMLGGGMRQAGIVAAAGIYALENNVDRMADDHANAAILAEGLGKHEVFRTNQPQTNIVMAEVVRGDVSDWMQRMKDAGVLAVMSGPQRMRLVTHINVTREDVEEAVARIDRIVEGVAV